MFMMYRLPYKGTEKDNIIFSTIITVTNNYTLHVMYILFNTIVYVEFTARVYGLQQLKALTQATEMNECIDVSLL